MVVGVMRDKNVAAILEALLPVASSLVCTAARTARAADPKDLAAAARTIAPDLPVAVEPRPLAAIGLAAEHGDLVVVAGSLYLIGEVRADLS
jgi:folylpolyglutamate synthase/dihydropteroate synthase